MTFHNAEFAAENMRGQFSLAYESVMAARFVGILIAKEQASKSGSDVQRQGRIAVLAAARKLMQDFADTHTLAALECKDQFLQLGKEE